MTTEETKFQPKDYKSDQYVRWCPGCGDHAVLNCLHKAMACVLYTSTSPRFDWASRMTSFEFQIKEHRY